MKTKKISRRAVTLAAFLLVSASSLHMACAEASVPFDYFTDDLSVSAAAVVEEDKYLPPEWFTKENAVSEVDSDTPTEEIPTPAGESSVATPCLSPHRKPQQPAAIAAAQGTRRIGVPFTLSNSEVPLGVGLSLLLE